MINRTDPFILHPSSFILTRRHGAAYVLVLTTGMLLSVVGLGILASSRATNRTISHTTDLAEATVLAESGVEWGLATLKKNSAWRTTYTHNVSSTSTTMGRGRFTFKLMDDVDTSLSNNTSDAVRVYGIGTCGNASRVYSVKLVGTGAVLDSLKNAAQAGGNFVVTGSPIVTGGPLSANGSLSVGSSATVTGDAEGSSLSISGTVTGSRTTLTSPRTLPQSTAFDSYKAQAMTIPFASISSGTITNKVISGASNPWGTANASGVYYIKVPSTGTLTIKSSRLVATLVVEMDPGGALLTSGSFAWDPPRSDFPALIVKATTGCTVSLAGATSSLSEAVTLTNFNPAGTPNTAGVADTDKSDSYPAEFHGLLHVVGTGFTTTLTTNFNFKGSLIAEGNVAISGNGVKLAADPLLASSPPVGYTSTSTMIPSPGTWKWEPGQ